ncbi:variable large family protein [Borrelia duttonii]|uniref:Variable large protein n=1 Tax=Borrelia duttonii (strain Ly) TaxID=412419 RepID=B5RP44_BORDL|nr:vlp protein, alpha subfamily [Borrelia duttonii Ly]
MRMKGIILMMVMMMGCNSGGGIKEGEGAAGGDGSGLRGVMMEVEKSAEHAFYSFIELVSSVLGLRVTADTTRNQVGEYFTGLASGIDKAMQELVKIGDKSKESVKEGKESELDKAIASAKGILTTLKGHIEALKDIGDGNKVVEVGNNQNGVTANLDALKLAYKALKGIVDTAKTQQVEEPKKSDVTIATARVGGTTPQNGARVLAKDANAGAASGLEAAAIVSSVSGKEILAAIVESGESDAEVGGVNATANTSAVSFARGGQAANLAQNAALAGAVSGGIALRSLVKDGKLAAHNANNDEKAVQSAGITAVNKLLVAVEDVIKKAVKNILEKVKKEVDKVRKPKIIN